MTIEEVKEERNQFQMALEKVITDFNNRTDTKINSISISYDHWSGVGELPTVFIEVKI